MLVNILALNEFLSISSSEIKKFKDGLLYAFSSYLIINISNLNFEFAFYTLLLFALLNLILSINEENALQNLSSRFFSIIYISLPISSFLILNNEHFFENRIEINPTNLIFSIFASVWVCDSLAFFGGKAFGKNKLAPKVSPNKTIEGALSGLIGAIAFSTIYFWVLESNLTTGLIVGISAGFFGQLGDLLESKIKRSTGVKDSSNLIPGHGGVLDRIDSLLFAGPTTLILLKIIY